MKQLHAIMEVTFDSRYPLFEDRNKNMLVFAWCSFATAFQRQLQRDHHRLRSRASVVAMASRGSFESRAHYDDETFNRGHSMRIEYDAPSADFFRGNQLTWVGELRSDFVSDDQVEDLDGSKVVSYPLREGGQDGRWSCEVVVPPFCQSILFSVTDGVRFDTNDNDYFRVWPEYFVEAVPGKKSDSGDGPLLRCFRRTSGNKEKENLGDVSSRDAGALERETRQAIKVDPEKVKLETVEESERGQRLSVSVSAEEQTAFQASRAHAAELGSKLGLSNVQVGEVRAAFEKFATNKKDSASPVERGRFEALLRELGFDDVVDEGRDRAIWAEHVGDDSSPLHLDTCIRIYHELDEAGEGLVIL